MERFYVVLRQRIFLFTFSCAPEKNFRALAMRWTGSTLLYGDGRHSFQYICLPVLLKSGKGNRASTVFVLEMETARWGLPEAPIKVTLHPVLTHF